MNERNYTVSEDVMTVSNSLRLRKEKLKLDVKEKSVKAGTIGQCEK